MQKSSNGHRDSYSQVNHKLGITESQIKASYESLKKAQERKKKGEGIVFSSDPLESDVAPVFVAVSSIQQFKAFVGVADGSDDKDIYYPPPMTAAEKAIFEKAKSLAELRSHMSDEFANKVKKAAEAYVMGNSEKVKDYTDIINDLGFPGRVAVFSGGPLVVPANTTYTVTGNDPVVWTYSTITVGAGGQILVQTQLNSTSESISIE